MKKLYQYKKKEREGLLLQIDDAWGEIAPLPGWSKETLEEATKETLEVLFENKTPTLPSVIFGFNVASLTSVKVPLCALHQPKNGCTTLKLKLNDVDEGIDRVKQYVGKYRLRIDCNRKWSLAQALVFAKHFKATDFEYLEEPVKTLDELIEFSNLTGFPIAVDETLRETRNCNIAKYAVIKPTLWGTIPKLKIPIILSSSYESSIGILQIARANSSEMPQGLDTFTPDFVNPPIQVENGFLTWTPDKNPIDTSQLCMLATAP